MEIQQIRTQKFQRESLPGILEIARASILPHEMENLHRLSDGATDAPVERKVILVTASSKANKKNVRQFFIRNYDANRFSYSSHRAEAMTFTKSDLIVDFLALLSKHPSEVMQCFTVTHAEAVLERNLSFRLQEMESAI